MPHPKKRERVSGDAIMNNMIAVDDPLKEKAHPIFGDVKIRSDVEGSGIFEASRIRKGKSVEGAHRGIDISVPFGGQVSSPFAGTVTKIGTWYKGDSETKYVQVSTGNHVMRFAYVDPSVKEGDVIKAGDILGVMRKPERWSDDITGHVHVEAVKGNEWKRNDRIDPTKLLGAVK
jgi:murein DD-endopeptidase MepM/ murein hydrolase activator NlpD